MAEESPVYYTIAVEFDKTPYYNVIGKTRSEDEIREDGLQKDKQTFSYHKKVSYKEFKKNFKSDGVAKLLGRKIIAIPTALIIGVLYTIYHLVKAIFVGIYDAYAYSDRELTCKVNLYSAIRDLQHSLGWLMRLVNDTYGTYLCQSADFHKDYYQCFLGNRKYLLF